MSMLRNIFFLFRHRLPEGWINEARLLRELVGIRMRALHEEYGEASEDDELRVRAAAMRAIEKAVDSGVLRARRARDKAVLKRRGEGACAAFRNGRLHLRMADLTGHGRAVRGISLLKAAQCIAGDDKEAVLKLKKRWQNMQSMPKPVGRSAHHSQTSLYRPADLLQFLLDAHQIPAPSKEHYAKRFHGALQPVRQ